MSRDLGFNISAPWQLVGELRQWVTELQITDASGLLVARAVITRENQLKPDRALQRLLVTAGPRERGGELSLREGWPAYQLVQSEPLRTRRGSPSESFSRHHVIAIAMDSTFITVDVQDYSNGGIADSAVRELLNSIRIPRSRNAHAGEQELMKLRDLRLKSWDEVNPIKLPSVGERVFPPVFLGLSPPSLAVPGWGELELSSSRTGRNVVIATNFGYANSTDFGTTFTTGPGNTPFPTIPTTRGDPSTAYGATGQFYVSYLAKPDGSSPGANNFNGCTVPVAASDDVGGVWNFRGNARQCTATITASSNCFADQEHIAADDRNVISRTFRPRNSPAITIKDDQVYAVWREFSATATAGAPTTCDGIRTATTGLARISRAACSTNGGRSWTNAPLPVSTAPTFDFSKITVGRDGSAYMLSALDKGDGWTEIWIDKFSSCQSGFQRQFGFPHVVGWLKTPTCAAGLDRCANLSSPTVAVSKDFADIVWIGAAFPSNIDNFGITMDDRIIVALSANGGQDFMGWRQISDNVPGRKFMPWICAAGKHLYATWYDRRPSSNIDNSLTDLFLARVDLGAAGPMVRKNLNISESPDSHCASGWPQGTRDQNSPALCTQQPQLSGLCNPGGGNCDPNDLHSPCGLTAACVKVNSGIPKYGDYNGLACAPGRVVAAWATQSPPVAGGAAGVWIRAYQTDQVPSDPSFDRWRDKGAVTRWWKTTLPP